MLNFLEQHAEELIVLILITLGAISYLCRKGNIQKLLVYVCLEAERRFGSKTGQVKLRYVYEWFSTKWPIMSALISFNQFSKMVDVALEEMRHLIDTNQGIFNFVNEEVDKNE